jgi:hypothetical protein
MRRRGRRAAGLAGALVLVVSAPACGSDPSPASDGRPLRLARVVAGTEGAGTARFEGSFRASEDEDADVEGTFRGAIDFAGGRSRMTVSGGDERDRSSSETIHVDGWTYVRVPANGPGRLPVAQDKAWTRLRFGSPMVALGGVGGIGDASALLEFLQRRDAEVEDRGTEEVRGAPTRRFSVTAGPPAAPAQLVALGEFDNSVPAMTYDLWIDAEDRLRRVRIEAPDEARPRGEENRGVYELELFEFGAPVTIDLPPFDQVRTDDVVPQPEAWEAVAKGRAGDGRWTVLRAPYEQGQCVAVETEPVSELYLGVASPDNRVKQRCSVAAGVDPALLTPVYLDVVTDAVALADGSALLYGSVAPDTTEVQLRVRGGDTRRVAPTRGFFASHLAADEVVDRITFVTPTRTIACPLDDDTADDDCLAGLGPR